TIFVLRTRSPLGSAVPDSSTFSFGHIHPRMVLSPVTDRRCLGTRQDLQRALKLLGSLQVLWECLFGRDVGHPDHAMAGLREQQADSSIHPQVAEIVHKELALDRQDQTIEALEPHGFLRYDLIAAHPELLEHLLCAVFKRSRVQKAKSTPDDYLREL